MRSSLLLLLLGCTGSPTPTATGPAPPSGPTSPIPGSDEGNLVLIRGYEGGELVRAELVGVFANTLQDYLNPAACLAHDHIPCLTRLPETPGASSSFDLLDRFVESRSFYRYVGLSIPLGPYRTHYRADDRISWYYADVIETGDTVGPADISLGVEWGQVELPAAVEIPPALNLISPANDQTLRFFTDQGTLPLVWEPADTGEIYLFVRLDDETEPGRVMRLEDDGSYDLSFDDLGLVQGSLVHVQLARWSRDTFDIEGNTLGVITTAEVDIQVEVIPVGPREPIPVGDDCLNPVALPPGGFYADLAGLSNTFEVADCLQSGELSAGLDTVYTVHIPPRHQMTLDLQPLQANGTIYLLESCDPIEPVCLDGADRGFGLQTETLTRFNPGPDTEQLYLVVDGIFPNVGGLFFLDHTSSYVPEPTLHDTCEEAMDADPLAPGVYYGADLDRLDNVLNPGFLGCASTSTVGPDGTTRIEVPGGATLEITVSMPDGDPALYLTSDCTDLDTCLTGIDTDGPIETLTYTNPTPDPQLLYLTLDSKGDLQPFFLTLTVL